MELTYDYLNSKLPSDISETLKYGNPIEISLKNAIAGNHPLYLTNTCINIGHGDLYKKKILTAPATKMWKREDPKLDLYNIVKRLLHSDKVSYVYDINGIPNEWFCVEKGTVYNGAFKTYDSAKHDGQEGGMPMNDELQNSVDDTNCVIHCHRNPKETECQTYGLYKSEGELVQLDELFLEYDEGSNQYEFFYKCIGNIPRTITINDKQSFNEVKMLKTIMHCINVHTFSKLNDMESGIVTELDKVGLKIIKDALNMTLMSDTDPKAKSYIKLTKDQFIRVMFDLKRAGDYMFVKACVSANNNPDMKTSNTHKFVYVSNDRSAICYSLLKNNPCILTTWTDSEGWTLTIYNPDAHLQSVTYQQEQDKKYVSNIVSSAVSKVRKIQNSRTRMDAWDKQRRFIDAVKKLSAKSKYDARLDMYVPKIEDETIESLVLPEDFQAFREYVNEQHATVKGKIRDRVSFKKSDDDYKAYIVKERNKDWFDAPSRGGSKKKRGGTGMSRQEDDTGIADFVIPVSDVLKHAVHPKSELYAFMKFYGKLSPTITFFKFNVFKHVFYMMFGEYSKRQNDVRPILETGDDINYTNTNTGDYPLIMAFIEANKPRETSMRSHRLNNVTNAQSQNNRPSNGKARTFEGLNNIRVFPSR